MHEQAAVNIIRGNVLSKSWKNLIKNVKRLPFRILYQLPGKIAKTQI